MSNWKEGELPPVGEIVSVFYGGRLVCRKFKIQYIGSEFLIGIDGDGVEASLNYIRNHTLTYTFKPLPQKTEREMTVEGMLRLHPEYNYLPKDIQHELVEFAKSLYDNGYHNGKKVKLLPKDWRESFETSNHQSLISWLLCNGYCIAEGE